MPSVLDKTTSFAFDETTNELTLKARTAAEIEAIAQIDGAHFAAGAEIPLGGEEYTTANIFLGSNEDRAKAILRKECTCLN